MAAAAEEQVPQEQKELQVVAETAVMDYLLQYLVQM
jgi:hypothetical protein